MTARSDLLFWADESPEPSYDIRPAFVDQDGHGLADGVASEAGFLHEGYLAGQLGPGRVRAVIDARTQVVRKLDMLGYIGTIELHKGSR